MSTASKKKATLFVGSSTEGLVWARALQEALTGSVRMPAAMGEGGKEAFSLPPRAGPPSFGFSTRPALAESRAAYETQAPGPTPVRNEPAPTGPGKDRQPDQTKNCFFHGKRSARRSGALQLLLGPFRRFRRTLQRNDLAFLQPFTAVGKELPDAFLADVHALLGQLDGGAGIV